MTLKERETQIKEKLIEARDVISENIRGAIEKVAIGKNVEHQLKSLQKGVENTFAVILGALDVPSRKEIRALEKKIDALAAKFGKAATGGAKKAARSVKKAVRKTVSKK